MERFIFKNHWQQWGVATPYILYVRESELPVLLMAWSWQCLDLDVILIENPYIVYSGESGLSPLFKAGSCDSHYGSRCYRHDVDLEDFVGLSQSVEEQ